MRILIIFSSSKGFTSGCMQQVAHGVGQSDTTTVKLVNVKKEQLPNRWFHYDKVVIASPLYAGRIHKRIRQFMHQHQGHLLRVPLFLCLSGMLQEQIEENMQLNFPEELRRHAQAVVWLGGRLQLKEHNPFVRMMLKKMGVEKEAEKTRPAIMKQLIQQLAA